MAEQNEIDPDYEVVIKIIRDHEAAGNVLFGNLYCDGLSLQTLENNNTKIGKGIFEANKYENFKYGNYGIYNRSQISIFGENNNPIQIRSGWNINDAVNGCILVGLSRGFDSKNNNNAILKDCNVALTRLYNKFKGGKAATVIIHQNDNEYDYNEKEQKEHEDIIAEQEFSNLMNSFKPKKVTPASMAINGLFGGLAIGAAMIGTAQMIKQELVETGQAEWGKMPPPDQLKPDICNFGDFCKDPPLKNGYYCSYHRWWLSQPKPYFNVAKECL